jgi:hypothetical protein
MKTPRASLHRIALLALALAAVAGTATGSTLDINGWAPGEFVTVVGQGSIATAEFGGTLDGFRPRHADVADERRARARPDDPPARFEAPIRAAWLVATFHPRFRRRLADGAIGITRETAIAALQVAGWEVMSDAPRLLLAFGRSAPGSAAAAVDPSRVPRRAQQRFLRPSRR